MNTGKIEKLIIGNFFKQKRIKAKFTQDEVAKKFGWSTPQFISNWERGLALPPKTALTKLMEIYDISKKEIVEVHTHATKTALEDYLKDLKTGTEHLQQ